MKITLSKYEIRLSTHIGKVEKLTATKHSVFLLCDNNSSSTSCNFQIISTKFLKGGTYHPHWLTKSNYTVSF